MCYSGGLLVVCCGLIRRWFWGAILTNVKTLLDIACSFPCVMFSCRDIKCIVISLTGFLCTVNHLEDDTLPQLTNGFFWPLFLAAWLYSLLSLRTIPPEQRLNNHSLYFNLRPTLFSRQVPTPIPFVVFPVYSQAGLRSARWVYKLSWKTLCAQQCGSQLRPRWKRFVLHIVKAFTLLAQLAAEDKGEENCCEQTCCGQVLFWIFGSSWRPRSPLDRLWYRYPCKTFFDVGIHLDLFFWT